MLDVHPSGCYPVDFFFMAAHRLAGDVFVSQEYARNTDANFLLFLERPGTNKLWKKVSPAYPASFREHAESLRRAAGCRDKRLLPSEQ